MTITNSSGSPIIINRLFAYWVKTPTSQILDELLLNSVSLWNRSDPDSPSDIPTESNWNGPVSDRTIPGDGTAQNFVIRFTNDLQPTGYEIHIIFDIGCQVIGTK